MGGVRAAMVAAVLCASGAALAQAQPSLGFHIGDGVLHPFLEGDATYNSLVGLLPGAGGTLAPRGEIVFHVRPGLKFDLLNPSTSVSFNGSAEYLFFSGLLTPGSSTLNRFQANVGVEAAFNKDGAVEVQLGDTLTRSDRTQNPAASLGVLSLYNNVHVAFPIHPGGRALEITPSVGWGIEFFNCITEVTSGSGACQNGTGSGTTFAGNANYSNLTPGLNARWKFLPKTAVVLDVQSDIRTYWQPTSGYLPATLLRAQAGMMGLISAYFNVTLLAGYVHDFAATNAGGINNVIGQAEVGYQAGDAIRISAGYLRTVLPVPGHASTVDDRPYLRALVGLWAGRLTLTAGASVDLLHYYYDPTLSNRNDLVVSGNAGATVAVLSWLDVTLQYLLSLRTVDVDPTQNYTRHEVTLRLGFHY